MSTVFEREDKLRAQGPFLLAAAQKLLARIDNMTTEQFSKGADRKEREALRKIVEKIDE